MMALVDPSTSQLSLGILFLVILLCPLLPLGRWLKAVFFYSPGKSFITDVELSIGSLAKPTPQLPHTWWTDEKQHRLERRAIFSTQWIYITHTSRFTKPGDYRTFEIAGFSVLLVLGKDHVVRAFHNICRHRAYAVTKKECGSSIVLGCKYHGWSYDTRGKLIKAPEFDKAPGFDKLANGLWELKSVIRGGMVLVNFDTGDVITPLPDLRWVDGFTKMKFVKEWKFDGAFNWKYLAEVQTIPYEKEQSSWRNFLSNLNQNTSRTIFPNTIIQKLDSKTIFTMRFLPKSATSTTLDCCLYTYETPRTIPEDRLQQIEATVKAQAESLQMQQRRLRIGDIPASNSITEKFKMLLMTHREVELVAGGEMNPAAQKIGRSSVGIDDDDFCRKLEEKSSVCKAYADGLLDW